MGLVMNDFYRVGNYQYRMNPDDLIRIGRYTLVPTLTASNVKHVFPEWKRLDAFCAVEVLRTTEKGKFETVGVIGLRLVFKSKVEGSVWHHFESKAVLTRETSRPASEDAVKDFRALFQPCDIFALAQWSASALADLVQYEIWKYTEADIYEPENV